MGTGTLQCWESTMDSCRMADSQYLPKNDTILFTFPLPPKSATNRPCGRKAGSHNGSASGTTQWRAALLKKIASTAGCFTMMLLKLRASATWRDWYLCKLCRRGANHDRIHIYTNNVCSSTLGLSTIRLKLTTDTPDNEGPVNDLFS